MTDFECAINFVLRNEGGLNDKIVDRDPGGLTNHGISFRFLKSLSKESLQAASILDYPVSEDTIRNLTIPQAKLLYFNEFWQHAPFKDILNQEHGNYIFDMAVNMGISPAIKCVQHACWAAMRKWETLKDDGILGSKTIAAINQCGFLIMPALRAERACFYRSLNQPEFLRSRYDRTYRT